MARQMLKIESPELINVNFSGKVTNKNKYGKRQFDWVIPSQEMADDLERDGWNVWYTKESEKFGPSRPCITVEMRWHDEENLKHLDPKIYKCTRKKPDGVLLTEDLVSDLDNDEIEDAVLWISPSHWEVNGKSGIKAYVGSLWVKIEESNPSKRFWGDDEYVEEPELPFEE